MILESLLLSFRRVWKILAKSVLKYTPAKSLFIILIAVVSTTHFGLVVMQKQLDCTSSNSFSLASSNQSVGKE